MKLVCAAVAIRALALSLKLAGCVLHVCIVIGLGLAFVLVLAQQKYKKAMAGCNENKVIILGNRQYRHVCFFCRSGKKKLLLRHSAAGSKTKEKNKRETSTSKEIVAEWCTLHSRIVTSLLEKNGVEIGVKELHRTGNDFLVILFVCLFLSLLYVYFLFVCFVLCANKEKVEGKARHVTSKRL